MSHQEHDIYAPVETGHPSPLTYFKVAMTLAIITAIEVGVLYIGALGHAVILILGGLSIAKFALVVMFYMHLKFDSKIFTIMFVAGLMTASGIILALMGLFDWFNVYG
jgi:cytochrome c oxidase subunit 4